MPASNRPTSFQQMEEKKKKALHRKSRQVILNPFACVNLGFGLGSSAL